MPLFAPSRTAPPAGGGTNATRTTSGGTTQSAAPVGLVPFIRASAEHGEPAGIDITRQMTAADQDLGVFDIPAYGYARYLVILVQATGGAGTGVTATEDAPFTSHKNIFLTEPNGAVLEQFDTAYGMFLANKWGGYKSPQGSDPRATPVFTGVGASTGNFTWLMRIPIELNSRDGLGSLPNQNAAAVFKLRLTLAGSGSVYSVLPTTLPNVRTRVFLEAWDQPEQSSGGQANQITPPAMNTTQFWSYQNFSVNAGANTLRLTRMGNYIRNLIFVFRRGGTSRANGNGDWPDPMTIFLDTRPLDIVELNNWRQRMYDRTGFGGSVGTITPANDTPNGLDNGVYVYDFMHEFDGELGRENRDLWLPTLGSTRFELQGTFANAGTLTVYTNDVAIAGNVFM